MLLLFGILNVSMRSLVIGYSDFDIFMRLRSPKLMVRLMVRLIWSSILTQLVVNGDAVVCAAGACVVGKQWAFVFRLDECCGCAVTNTFGLSGFMVNGTAASPFSAPTLLFITLVVLKSERL